MSEQKPIDRRNDVSTKLAWLIIAGLLGCIGSASAYQGIKAQDKADKAIEMVNDDRNRLIRLETQFESISYRLSEIKTILERPRGNGGNVQ